MQVGVFHGLAPAAENECCFVMLRILLQIFEAPRKGSARDWR